MDILIISTRDYYLYYQKEEQWKRCKCDEVIKFINDSYVSRNLECRTPIRNFFIKEGNATSFWRLGHLEFALLFHNHRKIDYLDTSHLTNYLKQHMNNRF